MKIPARCNRRSCQARRNLSKRPEQYARWPRCRFHGCGGRMYVDEYRLRRGAHDHPPTCKQDCYPYPHVVSSPDCRGRTDWILEQGVKPISPHRPVKTDPGDYF